MKKSKKQIEKERIAEEKEKKITECLKEEFINELCLKGERELVFYLELRRFVRATFARYGRIDEYEEYTKFYTKYLNEACPDCVCTDKTNKVCFRCMELSINRLLAKSRGILGWTL